MMLYDIHYRNKALDIDVPLPKARPDMERAINKNWDGHVKVPVKVGQDWVWDNQPYKRTEKVSK